MLKIFSFNPRTREGATSDGVRAVYEFVVSIHAPVKVRPFD